MRARLSPPYVSLVLVLVAALAYSVGARTSPPPPHPMPTLVEVKVQNWDELIEKLFGSSPALRDGSLKIGLTSLSGVPLQVRVAK